MRFSPVDTGGAEVAAHGALADSNIEYAIRTIVKIFGRIERYQVRQGALDGPTVSILVPSHRRVVKLI